MADPKPVTLVTVEEGDYDGSFEPEPLLVVGNLPDPVVTDEEMTTILEDSESDTRAALDALYDDGDQVLSDADVSGLIDDAESDTRGSLDTLYGDAAIAALVADSGSDTRGALDAEFDRVAAFVAVDDTPADAAAVASDLIAVRAALITAGLMAAS